MVGRTDTDPITALTFVPCYLPGFRSGGPVRTIANMVEQLAPGITFRIVTADRDELDVEPYPGVELDAWNAVGKAEVFYASPGKRSVRAIGRILRETRYDVLYLNSFFNPVFTLRPYLAMKMGLAPNRPCVIAPRGEFSEGAFQLKTWKKRPFVRFVRQTGWYRDVIWQASSEYEAADIRRSLGRNAGNVETALDLSPAVAEPLMPTVHRKREQGSALRVCFLSRIVPKKNLDFALRVVARATVPVNFDIYGPVGDERYWRRCRDIMASMPGHICASYRGEIPHQRVPEIMGGQDLFLLPTLGENYGHVIAEALAAGTPVLVSDTTPWRGLTQAGVGWDLPLDEEDAFVRVLEECARMELQAWDGWRERVRTYARAALEDDTHREANRRLFRLAIDSPQVRGSKR